MTFWEVVLLITGGLAAGVINTMAGGASALTVPLLVIAGVPGNQANGSNRIGVLAASASSLVSFRKSGVDGLRNMRTILVPAVLGSLLGSFGISQLADETFETIFGYLLVPIILLTIFASCKCENEGNKPVSITEMFVKIDSIKKMLNL